jgi:DNA-binding response OmpR family regulator
MNTNLPRILIVDSDEDFAVDMTTVLSREFEVEIVTDVSKAPGAAPSACYDAMILSADLAADIFPAGGFRSISHQDLVQEIRGLNARGTPLLILGAESELPIEATGRLILIAFRYPGPEQLLQRLRTVCRPSGGDRS